MKKRLPSVLLVLLLAWASSAAEYIQRFAPGDKTQVRGVAADRAGNIFICGETANAAALGIAIRLGPARADRGMNDGFLMKFAPGGQRLAAVVFGGGADDSASRLRVDAAGNVVVVGYTASDDFPTLNPLRAAPGGSSDGFVCKFDPSGTNLLFSTYLGGRNQDKPTAISLSPQGDIFIAGSTDSDDFANGPHAAPATFGRQDVFLVKLAGDGSQLNVVTRLGGIGSSELLAMALDGEGNALLAGGTTAFDFPTVNATQPSKPPFSIVSGFVTKVSSDGSLVFSTYLAGELQDQANAVAVNESGEIFVAGSTSSKVFPAWTPSSDPSATPDANHAFLAKLDPSGTFLFSTNFVRLTPGSHFADLAVASNGSVLAVGEVGTFFTSPGIPMFTTLRADGSVSTFFDPLDCDTFANVEGMAIDPTGNVFVLGAGLSAGSSSLDSYVAKYSAGTLQETSAPMVKILEPAAGERVAPRYGVIARLGMAGMTGAVQSVTYYEGRRRIGVVTNAPFGLNWNHPARGPHSLRAVAMAGGISVTSCVVRFTVGSPRHDDFAHRVRLAGERVTISGDTTGATREGPQGAQGPRSVWYSWTAPREGVFEFQIESDQAGDTLSIHLGSQLAGLIGLTETQDAGRAYLRARRGRVYQLQVSSFFGGPFRLHIRRVQPPAHDNFADAGELQGEPAVVTTTLRHATVETGEPNASGDAGTIWYSWTAPESGLFLAAVEGPGQRLEVEVYTGSMISNLTSVGQGISGTTNGSAWSAQPAGRYFIRLRGNDTNDVTLRIARHAPAPNDNFADRTLIPPGVTAVTGTLIGATSEPGEPGNDYVPSHSTVWWTWSPPTAGAYRLVLVPFQRPASGAGTTYSGSPDSRPVAAYIGDAVDHLVRVSSGDAFGLTLFNASPDTNYHFQVSGGAASFALEIQPVAAPANDAFTSAIPLTGGLVTVVGSTIGATLEPGEPDHTPLPFYPPSIDSVWYRWTAPSNGVYSLSCAGGSFDIYTGDSLTGLTAIATTGNNHMVRLTAGIEYRIAVGSVPLFQLNIRQAFPPGNDDFANRTTIAGLQIHFGGSIRDASTEPEEPRAGEQQARASIWFSWTAPTNGSFVIRSTNDTAGRIAVYIGGALSGLSPVGYGQRIEFDAYAGVTYQIAVAPDYFSSNVSLELRYQPPPRNDRFENRLRLTGERISLVASNVGATLEPGEPLTGVAAAGHTVWWTWRAPRAGRATFSVQGVGPEYFNPSFGLYSGLSLTQLVAQTSEFTFGDGFNLPVRAGADLQISVDHHQSSASGRFRLDIRFTPAPGNDAFANRQVFGGEASGTVEGASREQAEPADDFGWLDASVWWTWTAPTSGVYELSLPTSSSPMGIFVYTGQSLGELDPDEGSPNNVSALVRVRVSAGTTYVIQLLGSATGKQYTLRAQYVPPPANDAFAHRIALHGPTVRATGSALGATAEAGEPLSEAAPGHSIWWKWIAPETGRYTFAVSNASPDVVLTLFAGTKLTNLAVVASNAWTRPVLNIPATAGSEIAISVDAGIDTLATLKLTIRKSLPPANDDFASRATLGDGPALGALEASSREAGEPGFDIDPAGTSIWWTFTPTNDGVHALVASTDFVIGLPPGFPAPQASLSVYTGSALTNLNEVRPPGYRRGGLYLLASGVEYHLLVRGENGWIGPVKVSVEFLPPASNDCFTNAVEIFGDFSYFSGSNDFARVEPGEPARPLRGGNSIWWKWTAERDGVYVIAWLNSPLDAATDVYTGASVSNLTAVPDTVWGHDRGGYLFRAAAGTTYYIAATSSYRQEGPIELVLARANPPPNDDFAQRTLLNGAHISLIASNHDATEEPGDPAAGIFGHQTVWWKWTAPAAGLATVTVQSIGDPFNFGGFQGSVFRGDSISNLVRVGTAFSRQTQFQAEAGLEYAIGITTWFAPAAFFTLTLDAPEPLPAPVGGMRLLLRPRGQPAVQAQIVETSTNLVDWIPFSTNVTGQTEIPIMPDRNEPRRFFRVR